MIVANISKPVSPFNVLVNAVPDGRVTLAVDIKIVCHPSCPLPLEYLKGRIVHLFLALIASILIAQNIFELDWNRTLIAMTATAVVYWAAFRPFGRRSDALARGALCDRNRRSLG